MEGDGWWILLPSAMSPTITRETFFVAPAHIIHSKLMGWIRRSPKVPSHGVLFPRFALISGVQELLSRCFLAATRATPVDRAQSFIGVLCSFFTVNSGWCAISLTDADLTN